jgi:hypothetical protein
MVEFLPFDLVVKDDDGGSGDQNHVETEEEEEVDKYDGGEMNMRLNQRDVTIRVATVHQLHYARQHPIEELKSFLLNKLGPVHGTVVKLVIFGLKLLWFRCVSELEKHMKGFNGYPSTCS